ncbi:hypothetical protein Dimus_027040 [Dionaea muscipula]
MTKRSRKKLDRTSSGFETIGAGFWVVCARSPSRWLCPVDSACGSAGGHLQWKSCAFMEILCFHVIAVKLCFHGNPAEK